MKDVKLVDQALSKLATPYLSPDRASALDPNDFIAVFRYSAKTGNATGWQVLIRDRGDIAQLRLADDHCVDLFECE